MKNKFFLRDDYTTPEKRDRIHSSKINAGVDGFESVLDLYGYDPEHFGDLNKNEFFTRMGNELEDEYDDFVHDLWEEVGNKGDTFNLKILSLPPERDYSQVAESARDYEERRIDEVYGDISNVLSLRTVEDEDDYIDLGFRTAERITEITPDEEMPIIIRDAGGGIEETYEEGYTVEAPTQSVIEARIYPSGKFVAISNSGVKNGVQRDIGRFIVEQADQLEEASEEGEEADP